MLEPILIAAIAIGLYFAVASIIKNKNSCGGCCSGCPHSGGCHQSKQEGDAPQ
ncbi:MAG: FeoB-associated Cys-rich membrane protein [Clostridiales bacterium]|nr:FeoB-associated Cys-rich membrane protein [Clostridiales bacterium]